MSTTRVASQEKVITTSRTIISSVVPDDALSFRDYYLRNSEHLKPWEPPRPTGFHSEEAWFDRAKQFTSEVQQERAYRYVARIQGKNDLVAVVNFNNIVRGAFQACHLGYSVDAEQQGNGVMYEILFSLIPHVFEQANLHRIMANYIPENTRSGRLLERLGFEKEGYAKDYLFIGDGWKDHILTALINPHYKAN